MQQGQDGELTVVVPPELDLATSQQLADVLAQACASDPPHVIVDLSRVTFCDLVALRVLLDAADRVAAKDCRLSLHEPPAMLQRMAQLLGLSGRLGLPER